MRDFVKLSTTIWDSRKFRAIRKDQTARFVYLYLLSTDESNSGGVFHLSISLAAHRVNVDPDDVLHALDTLVEIGLIEYDEPTETVMITNWFKFNSPYNLSHALGTARQLRKVDCKRLRHKAATNLEESSRLIGYLQKSKPLQRAIRDLRHGVAPTHTETETETIREVTEPEGSSVTSQHLEASRKDTSARARTDGSPSSPTARSPSAAIARFVKDHDLSAQIEKGNDNVRNNDKR